VIVGLDHVQVAAPPGSETEARRFYGELLGLREIPKPAGVAGTGGAWFECGPQELHVGIEDSFEPARKAHPGFAVRDHATLDALAERLTAAGVPVKWDDRLEGVRRFYAEDPWGNRLELCVPARVAPSPPESPGLPRTEA
jgi:catechol 2,3-dioxygenase-like lactoylglutathione lyase family enzyme